MFNCVAFTFYVHVFKLQLSPITNNRNIRCTVHIFVFKMLPCISGVMLLLLTVSLSSVPKFRSKITHPISELTRCNLYTYNAYDNERQGGWGDHLLLFLVYTVTHCFRHGPTYFVVTHYFPYGPSCFSHSRFIPTCILLFFFLCTSRFWFFLYFLNDFRCMETST